MFKRLAIATTMLAAFAACGKERPPRGNRSRLLVETEQLRDAIKQFESRTGRLPLNFEELGRINAAMTPGWRLRILKNSDGTDRGIAVEHGDYVENGYCIGWDSVNGDIDSF